MDKYVKFTNGELAVVKTRRQLLVLAAIKSLSLGGNNPGEFVGTARRLADFIRDNFDQDVHIANVAKDIWFLADSGVGLIKAESNRGWGWCLSQPGLSLKSDKLKSSVKSDLSLKSKMTQAPNKESITNYNHLSKEVVRNKKTTATKIVEFWESTARTRAFKPDSRKGQLAAARSLLDKHEIEEVRLGVKTAIDGLIAKYNGVYEMCPRSLNLVVLNRGTMFERTLTFHHAKISPTKVEVKCKLCSNTRASSPGKVIEGIWYCQICSYDI